jgi:hypothetical protein
MTYLGKFVEMTFKFNVVLPNTLTPQKKHALNFKSKMDGEGFCTQFQGVLYYFME